MATASNALITADQFSGLPEPADGSRQELVRGKVITMSPTGGRHGDCCSRIDRRVGGFVEQADLGTVTTSGTGFICGRNPDTVRAPELAFWSRQRLSQLPDGFIEIPPDLAVEVISPSDLFSRVHAKVREYLAAGVRLVWIVDPQQRTVSVHRPGQPVLVVDEDGTLSAEDVLPGFSCRVAELFSPAH
jgi:Uma2 family endonuclease